MPFMLFPVLHQLDPKIIYSHYDFKHLTEKYFEIGMKLDDFLIQLVKYCISTEYTVTTRTVRGWTDEFEESLAKRGAVAIDYVKGLGKEAGIKVEPVFLRGTSAEEILDYAEDNDIDLIMMGTHGLTGVKRFLIDSVAEKVLRHSKIPVMIIR